MRSSLLLCVAACSAAFQLSPHAASAPQNAQRHAAIRCGPRVKIYSVGKEGRDEPWITTAINEYTKRLRGTLEVECVWVRDDAALLASVRKSADASETAIVLDERGPTCTSTQFADRLYDGLEAGGSRLSFFIGGADGLPPSLKSEKRERLLSLSSLTFPHQVARLLLVEQIYRSSEIRKGSGYHKD